MVLTWHGVWSLEDLIQKKYFHDNETTAWISFVSKIVYLRIYAQRTRRIYLYLAISRKEFLLNSNIYFQGFGVLTCFIVYILQFLIAICTKKYEKTLTNTIENPDDSIEYDSIEYTICEYKICPKTLSPRYICLRICNIIMILIGIISTINMFRGYWFLLDEYFMTTQYNESLIHGQIYGALVLMVCFAGSSLHAGVFRDDYIGEKCLVEFYYTSYFYIKVR